MKTLLLIICSVAVAFTSQAQLGGVINNAKKKAEEKINKEVDKTIDGEEEQTGPENNSAPPPASDTSAKSGTTQATPASIKVYSKYDFVPGALIVAYEDFSQDQVGDFPAKWATNSSAEIVTLDGYAGRWLLMTQPGVFMPEFIDTLPDNFTFEFDLFCIQGNNVGSWGTLYTSICELSEREKPQEWQGQNNSFSFSVYGGNGTEATIGSVKRKDGTSESGIQTYTKQLANKSKPAHVAVWRQKERIRVYFNEEKVLDLPKALTSGAKFNSIIYFQPTIDDANKYCVSNLRLAAGAPDTRSKLITEGKWVTHGILFDVNSANIKPESYGTLKQLADVLKENPEVKVKIVGYTDADGDEAKNLDLSKQRAASVKDALAKEFGIGADRMETDGKGEAEPIDSNKTPEGKANNRRVEFVKI
jgi:outer membrane protein OmpA-like peptidoglycan-associated protein